MTQTPPIHRGNAGVENAPSPIDEVRWGLRAMPRTLPCKFFYDARGSELFERICELEEYYPTRCELEIMERSGGEIAERCGPHCALIELGSGSSVKTHLLLEQLREPAALVTVDISEAALSAAAERLREAFPKLRVMPVWADYLQSIELPALPDEVERRVIYFPGSTIGNFHRPDAIAFLRRMRMMGRANGAVLIGVDLRKDRATLEAAYNDSEAVTAAFNLNLLHHLNRIADVDFDVSAFEHRAVWNDVESRIEMHLVSMRDQTVHAAGELFELHAGETIRTECSYKYTRESFANLAGEAELHVKQVWTDARGWFSVQWLEA